MSDKFFDSVKEAANKHAEALFGDASWNDAAFLVEKNAEKKPGGTASNQYMQKYRHLVHHEKTATDPNSNSTVNLSHLRNALARQNQVQPLVEDAAGFHARAKAHLTKHAKALLKTYQKGSVQFAEVEALCAEFNISLDPVPSIQVIKNGPENKPYCVIDQQGKQVECYVTMAQAQDRVDKMMNKK